MFEPGTYFVTGATHQKALLFRSAALLTRLQRLLLRTLAAGDWRVQAWAVFPNHYHFVAISPSDPASLEPLLKGVHAKSALTLNELDHAPGRQVWFQYWDTHLTYRTSYFARLRYVHQNAVHHGVVAKAENYQWCSAGWLAQYGETGLQRLLASFDTSTLNVYDDFEVPKMPEDNARG